VNGPYRTFHESGKVREESNFENNLRAGHVLTYHENGQIETDTLFEKGKVVDVKEFDMDGKPVNKKARFSEVIRINKTTQA